MIPKAKQVIPEATIASGGSLFGGAIDNDDNRWYVQVNLKTALATGVVLSLETKATIGTVVGDVFNDQRNAMPFLVRPQQVPTVEGVIGKPYDNTYSGTDKELIFKLPGINTLRADKLDLIMTTSDASDIEATIIIMIEAY